MTEIFYQCVRCGKKAPASEWERPGTGTFKCPRCSYKYACKIRPPIVKKVKAI